jgi:D-alanyl-lipoteichoic acid acyltransferase DltB (MBOAT superfamily)
VLTTASAAAVVVAALLGARAVGPRGRWVVLLAASYGLYATAAPYLPLVLAAVTLLSFHAGRILEGGAETPRSRAWLLGGVAAALGALAVLKYTGFLGGILASAAGLAGGGPARAVANPFVHVGVSYWALQVISYLLDVSQGVVPAERHLGRFALYLAFFPKLVQGPIERPGRLLPQLEAAPAPTGADLSAAFPLVVWGAFQKFAVADRLGAPVDAVFAAPASYPGISAFLAVYLFAAQLYFDFAGYTCIAIGVARAFGIRLSPNFDAPYLATSIAEFWRRWHMTFSSWILDYVFKPVQLGLRRWRTWGTPVALLVAFSFSGLWHGPTWGFVAWGVLHGVYLSAAVLLARPAKRLRDAVGLSGSPLLRPLQILATFHLVCVAWVLFRAASLRDAATLLAGAVAGLPASLGAAVHGGAGHVLLLDQGARGVGSAAALAALATFLPRVFPELSPRTPAPAPAGSWRFPLTRSVAYAAMLYVVLFVGASTQSFIYARF